MNSVSIFSNILRDATTTIMRAPIRISLQQTRNTFVLRRRHPPGLYKKGSFIRLKGRNFLYDLVENTDLKRKPPIKLILTQFVDGVGDRGQIITKSPLVAYNDFLLPGLAVYGTPDNVKKFDAKDVEKHDESKRSRFAERTLSFLSQFLLNVVMSAKNPWTLEKWHVRASFRKCGTFLNEDCITMPERPVSGPNFDIENKEFYVTVTVNQTTDVKVRCRIHHWSNDPSKIVPSVQDFYLKQSEPIFPEDKEVLDSLPLPYLMQQAMLKASAKT